MKGVDAIAILLARDGLIVVREHPGLKAGIYQAWHAGRLRRLHPGVFAGRGTLSEPLRLRALARWAPRSVIHGRTAAALWLGEWNGGPVALASPVALVAPAWVRLTRRTIPEQHVRWLGGARLVEAAYAAAELAAIDGGRCAMRMFVEGLASPQQVLAASADLACTEGNEARCRVLRELERDPWSPAELILHRLLRGAGIVGWVANPPLRIEGRVIRPDVLLGEAQLILEVDGWAFHGGRDAFQLDRDRQNALTTAGYRVLRFTWQDLTDRPQAVVARIRRTLARTNLPPDPRAGR